MRLATQSVRVPRPGGTLAGGKQPDQRVELVGNRHRGPRDRASAQLRARRRRLRLHGHRQVVVVDGLPHGLGQAFLAGVDAAHGALQFGELAHQIGPRSALASRPAFAADAASAGCAVPLAPPTRPVAPRARPWPCSFPASCGTGSCRAGRSAPRAAPCGRRSRKLRVAQPRREHPLRVAADEFGPIDFDVGHRQERRLQLAVVVHHREVVLVMDHRRGQHFLGQREELGGKHAGDHRRPLHQIRDLVEQPGLTGRRPMDASAQPAGVHVELAHDPLAPILAFEDDEVLEQARLVVLERLDLDGAARAPAGGEKAVAVGRRARRTSCTSGDCAPSARRMS